MLRWQDTSPKDISNQTRKAQGYLRSHPKALSLPEDPDAQGNGAVMRAAAHGVKATDAEESAENAWTEAALTHPSWKAQASGTLVEGRDAPDKHVRETLRPPEGYEPDPGGWTVYTTRLALLGLLDAPGFRPGLEGVVRLGVTPTLTVRSRSDP